MAFEKLLNLFNLRGIEIDLYSTLFYNGEMGASEIAKQINISRTAVYDLLQKLIAAGLIIETIKSGIKKFSVQPPEKLELLIAEKEKNLASAKDALSEMKKEFLTKRKNLKPIIQIYEGKKELEQMMKDMLLYRDITVDVFWPADTVLKTVLSPEFMDNFHQERIARNINIRVIWPESEVPSIKEFPFVETSNKYLREVHLASKEINFSFGYAIYGNTIRFISINKDYFGFLVENKEMAEMLKSHFDLIWKNSKPFTF